VHLHVSFRTSGRGVSWILVLRNKTDKTLRFDFPTSMYANVVVHRAGKRAYSWAWGLAFLQAFTNRTLGPRETYTCALASDELDFDALEPGRYHVSAYLNTPPSVWVEGRRSFTITDG
jgi:Intracellular proteinase inhibitor